MRFSIEIMVTHMAPCQNREGKEIMRQSFHSGYVGVSYC